MSSKTLRRLSAQLHSRQLSTRLASFTSTSFYQAAPSISYSFRHHHHLACSHPSHHPPQPKRPFSTTAMGKDQDHIKSKQTGEKEESHQHQAGNGTDREIDQWKHREPYAVHDHERNDNFDVKWEGSCHCGKVTYELSRDKPLSAKYCHCTTCQRLHGVSANPFQWCSP